MYLRIVPGCPIHASFAAADRGCCRRHPVRALSQEKEKREERGAFANALQSALAELSPPADARERWADTEFAPGITHIETFAKGNTDAPHGQALFAMLDTGVQVTADGAAHLLKRLGIWPARMPNAVVRPACAHRRSSVRLPSYESNLPHGTERHDPCT